MMKLAAAAYRFMVERRLAFPAFLIVCNLASAAQCFAAGDYKRGVYWLSSAVCLLCVAL
jgi:hypothetical protein